MQRFSRRSAIGIGLAGIGVVATGAFLSGGNGAALAAMPPVPPPLTVRITGKLRLHMIQTGWVSVKEPHHAFDGPAALRIPAIMASRRWTEWLPVTAFVIEHPDALVVVDAGETARIAEPDYARCDAGTGMFYRRNLRFAVTPEQEVGAQMAAIGLDPARVSDVVMTHLHSDHMGGMGAFTGARFHIAEAALHGHTGALMCRIPAGLDLRATRLEERPKGVFGVSAPVTQDGAISIIPTPGHASGHQSVIIEDEGRSLCIAGDAAFSLGQIQSGEMAGIVEQVSEARRTLGLLRRQYAEFGTVMLPTHDPGNRERLLAI